MNNPLFFPTDSYQLIIKFSGVSLDHISKVNVLIKIRTLQQLSKASFL